MGKRSALSDKEITEPAQKRLWMKRNKKKLSSLAQLLDASVTPNNLSAADIDALITEARKHGRQKVGD